MSALVVAALVRRVPFSVVVPMIVPILVIVPVSMMISVSPVFLPFLLFSLHHHFATHVLFLFHFAVTGAKLVLSENTVEVGLDNLFSV